MFKKIGNYFFRLDESAELIERYFRLRKDKRSGSFHKAPLWLVVKINDELNNILKKLPFLRFIP